MQLFELNNFYKKEAIMSVISDAEAPNLQQVDLTTLNIQQLSALKQQIDQVSNSNLKIQGKCAQMIIL